MIRSISIENFRGIPALTLGDLTPLVVLVGPNGCGKSTVLDAMLLGAAPEPNKALRYVVERRVEHSAGARWLFPRGEVGHTPTIKVSLGEHQERVACLDLPIGAVFDYNAQEIRIGNSVTVNGAAPSRFDVVFRPDGHAMVVSGAHPIADTPPIRIVEPQPGSRHADLARVHAEAFKAGQLDHAVQLLADLVPGVTSLQTLQEASGANVVYLGFKDGAVPAGVAGDGILALMRLAFELALPPGSTALVEEPEVHQHPRSQLQSARAIVAAVRRGIQVVLSTHSLELIDDLLDCLGEADLPLLTLFSMAQRKGLIHAARHPGPEVHFVRTSIGEDLR